MDKQRNTAQRIESRKLLQQPFVGYIDAYSNNTIFYLNQCLLSMCLSKKEKILHRTNRVIQSKLNSTVELLKLEEKSNIKLIRCDALRFLHTRRGVNDLGRSVSLNVGCPTRNVPDDQKSSHLRSKSTPPSMKSAQLTCIIAPSTSDSSSIFRLPFNERKQTSRSENWNKQHHHQQQLQCIGKRKDVFSMKSTKTVERSILLHPTCVDSGADETSLYSKDTDRKTNSSSQFKPIDSDECVKIVRKAKPRIHIETVPQDSVDILPTVISINKTRLRNTVMP